MAYESNESGSIEIYVRSFRDGDTPTRVSNGGGSSPVWSADGRELFYRSDGRIVAAGADSLTGPRVVLEATTASCFDITPDGESFVIVEKRPAQPDAARLNLVLKWSVEIERLLHP